MPETASDLFVERLMDWGVDTIFGLPGDGINGLMEALRKRQDRIRYVHIRHEEVAAMAAVRLREVHRQARRLLRHRGPRRDPPRQRPARRASLERRAAAGDHRHDLPRPDRHALPAGLRHRLPVLEPGASTTSGSWARRTSTTSWTWPAAPRCRTAAPTHIAFPIDYQTADADDLMRFKRNVPGHTTTAYAQPVRTPPQAELQRAAELLAGGEKIAILAGQGARGAGDELEQVAETLGAPIVKASLGKDCVPDDSPFTTGGIGVIGTRPIAGRDGELRHAADRRLLDALHRVPARSRARPSACRSTTSPSGSACATRPTSAWWATRRRRCRSCCRCSSATRSRAFLEQAQSGMREWWELMERSRHAPRTCR